MKRVLGFLAAGILAVASVSSAVAEEVKGEVHVHSEVAAEAPAVIAREFKLVDGTVVHVEGDHAFVVDAEGNKTPAPDGEHTLADGTVFEVKAGVASGLPAEAPDAEPAAGEAEAAADGAVVEN